MHNNKVNISMFSQTRVKPGITSKLLFCVLKKIIDIYSKTCIKPPLKNRQNKDLNDKW